MLYQHLWFCHSQGDFVCVFVYREYTAVLMYGMHRVGVEYNSMLLAARLLVYTQLDRGSSKQ